MHRDGRAHARHLADPPTGMAPHGTRTDREEGDQRAGRVNGMVASGIGWRGVEETGGGRRGGNVYYRIQYRCSR